jgi:hypothetical protein
VPIAPSGRVEDIIQTTNGSYLAVGSADWNGAVWRSDDGIAWTRLTGVPLVLPDEAKGLNGVIQTNDGYLAWGGGGARYSEGGFTTIWISADGVRWLEAARWTGFLLDVTQGGPGYVGIGSQAGLDNLNGAMAWSSMDGKSWSESPSVPGDGGGMLALAPFDGRLVAVGATRVEGGWVRGRAWQSADGVHWILANGDLEGALSSLAVFRDGLIAGGSVTVDPINGGLERPVIRSSNDGSTWRQTFARECCGYVTDIVAAGDELLASYRWWIPEGPSGDALTKSQDGVAWDEIGTPELDSGVLWIRLMHLGGSLGIVGIGIKDIGNNEYQPVLLIPPRDSI